MTQCNRCQDKTDYEWYEDFQGKWKLGIKLDINNFRPHKCSPLQNEKTSSNKRNWVDFICEKCGLDVKQNVKLLKSKSINLCLSCSNQ